MTPTPKGIEELRAEARVELARRLSFYGMLNATNDLAQIHDTLISSVSSARTKECVEFIRERAKARGEWSRDYEADLDDLLTSIEDKK